MAHAHITVELHAAGDTIATVDVPLKLTTGEPANGYVPINADTADLTARIQRGVEAFSAAVADK